MLAPAAFWGGAVPSAAQTAGMEPSRAYDAATPSAIESAGLGFMMASHSRGLRSGGLMGYSTFFTGYDPSRGHGTGRMLSLGRLGAQGVSVAARGLMHTPLGNVDRAANVLRPLTMAHKYGVGGAMHAIAQGPSPIPDPTPEALKAGSTGSMRHGGRTAGSSTSAASSRSFMGAARESRTNVPFSMRTGGTGAGARKYGAPSGRPSPYSQGPGVPASSRKYDAPAGARSPYYKGGSGAGASARKYNRPTGTTSFSDAAASARRSAREGAEEVAEAAGKTSWGEWIIGAFGREGYNKGGTSAAFREVTEEIGDSAWRFPAAADDTAGALLAGGPAGRAMGAAFRIGVGYEAVRLGVDAATYAVGEAYESMVETTSAIRSRIGSDRSMSPAYYNRGAATERQRARRELNIRSLNPRTQLMGNEAAMAHG